VLGGLNRHAFDIAGWYDPGAWYAALLTGMFNITPEPTVLEVIAWVAYGVPALVLFLWPARKTKTSVPAEAETIPAPQA